MNKKKIIGFAILFVVILGFTKLFKSEPEIKTAQQLAEEKAENEAKQREEKIDYALTRLKEMIKSKMKNPDSYEMMARTWDKKDTGEVVKILIQFRGDNSFGGKAVTTVFANYNMKDDSVVITKTEQQ